VKHGAGLSVGKKSFSQEQRRKKKGHQLHIFHTVALQYDNHINADSGGIEKRETRFFFTLFFIPHPRQ
jgi:hypothetical protein